MADSVTFLKIVLVTGKQNIVVNITICITGCYIYTCGKQR